MSTFMFHYTHKYAYYKLYAYHINMHTNMKAHIGHAIYKYTYNEGRYSNLLQIWAHENT